MCNMILMVKKINQTQSSLIFHFFSKMSDELMPPPKSKKKIVLDEDTFQENLTRLTRKIYYPDSEKYKAQLDVYLFKLF